MNEELRRAAEAATDPMAYPWITYAWVILIAAWGGLIRFLNTLHKRREKFSVALCTLTIGLMTSVFVGVMTFYACELGGVDRLKTAMLVAGTGFMGGESIRVIEGAIAARLKLLFSVVFGGKSIEKPD